MIHLVPAAESIFGGVDVMVEARRLTREPREAIQLGVAHSLPIERMRDSLQIVDVLARNGHFDVYTLHDNRLATIPFAFRAGPVDLAYPTHRCPDCRYFLDDDAPGRCLACGARLAL